MWASFLVPKVVKQDASGNARPEEALPGTIRGGTAGKTALPNVVHGSGPEESARNCSLVLKLDWLNRGG